MRRSVFRLALPLVLFLILAGESFAGVAKPHRLVVQINQNDPVVMNLALNNVTNVVEYYKAKGEPVSVEIVAFGAGLNMLRQDKSTLLDRISTFQQKMAPSKVQFSACNNTMKRMEKEEGHPISIVQNATIVPSGVVRVIELQEKGWSYVRP
jgi:intracellular sulfur oxidation DsrE/DsrF family protein